MNAGVPQEKLEQKFRSGSTLSMLFSILGINANPSGNIV